MADCVFCAIVAGAEPASVVLDEGGVLAFMDIRQASPGHVLVIPKQHLADLREFDAPTAGDVMWAVTRVARAVDRAFEPDGLTVVHAIGQAGGQDVFHAHVHVHPRFLGDGLLAHYTGGSPLAPSRGELDRQAREIRAALS